MDKFTLDANISLITNLYFVIIKVILKNILVNNPFILNKYIFQNGMDGMIKK